jgi:hypothetical protein
LIAEIIAESVVTIFLSFYVLLILVLVDRLRSYVEKRRKPSENLFESDSVSSSLVHEMEVMDE